MGRPKKWNKQIEDRYLGALAATGRKQHSADVAGVSYATTVAYAKSDPDFAARILEAERRYDELVEKEIERRAMKGLKEPVYQGGKFCFTKKKFSDQLLLALAKKRMPEYRDKAVEVDVREGGVLVVGGTAADADEWRKKHNEEVREDEDS